jgi:hypothetical protein
MRGPSKHSTHPLYGIWKGMLDRCYNPKSPSYKYYGALGVSVCERWRDSFQDFLADVGKRRSSKLSLDRYPNNSGDYEPGNVRWATSKQQNRNKKRSSKYTGSLRLVTMRLDEDSVSLLNKFSKKDNMTKTSWIRLALRERWFQETGMRIKDTDGKN